MDGAQEGAEHAHRAGFCEHQRQQQARRSAQRDAQHGKGNGVDERHAFNGEHIRMQQTAEQAQQISLRVQRADFEVSGDERNNAGAQQHPAGAGIAEARKTTGSGAHGVVL